VRRTYFFAVAAIHSGRGPRSVDERIIARHFRPICSICLLLLGFAARQEFGAPFSFLFYPRCGDCRPAMPSEKFSHFLALLLRDDALACVIIAARRFSTENSACI